MEPPSESFATPLAPARPLMGTPNPDLPPVHHKEKKMKKHKKHKRHDSQESKSKAGIAAIKLRIKVGGTGPGTAPGGSGIESGVGGTDPIGENESSNPGLLTHTKKKKKKKEKKKDKEKKHRHHHKDKRKRDLETSPGGLHPVSEPLEPEIVRLTGSGDTGSSLEPPSKRLAVEPAESGTDLGGHAGSKKETEDPESHHDTPQEERRPFLRLLDYILPLLEKRDVNHFFAFPVSDKIAPGYSQIIKKPMDFSTMKSKLKRGEYGDIHAFQDDFELMCTNAMTYNTQDTIYYKMAKKLLTIGKCLFTPDKLIPMRDQLPWLKEISEDELGFDIMSDPQPTMDDDDDDDDDDARDDVSKVIEDIREVVRRPLGRFEAIPDDLTSREILEQARQAAKGAAEKLQLYRPHSQMGFLRQKSDGSTSLSFLTGSAGVVPGTEKDRPVSLGSLIGKVKQGSGAIQGFREDRRNVVKAIHPLYYGAFSSHGPSYDSTFANLTKEETDMVTGTYGEDIGTQYAESILNFSRNCDYAMFIVDHLLDILTENEHRKTSKYIEEKKNLRREDEMTEKVFEGAQSLGQQPPDKPTPTENDPVTETEPTIKKEAIDFESLKSLSEDGIDMSFLDNLKTEYNETLKIKEEEPEIDPKVQLEATAQLIQQLRDVQHERLSQAPPQHFSSIPKPSEKELNIASQVQKNLSTLAKQVKPENIVPDESIRKLLGIPIDPPPS